MPRGLTQSVAGSIAMLGVALLPPVAHGAQAPPPWNPPPGATAVLQPCADAPRGYCGSVPVPLDRDNPDRGTISIAFEFFPHIKGATARGTLVPNPGGPGEAPTGPPGGGRSEWRSLFGPVLDTYNLLVIDNRGLGKSGDIDCPEAQDWIGGMDGFFDAIAACGARLGQAADLYGSAAVAHDVEAVRAALGIEKLTYYGLSYGGVDVEAYATRYGEHLDAVVADAPWTSLVDPMQRFVPPALVRRVALSCGRALGCSAEHVRPARELEWLVKRLRRGPIVGSGRDFEGKPYDVRLDEPSMTGLLVDSAGASFAGPGEVAAAVAAFRRGDRVPLLRLAAERLSNDYSPPGGSATFSIGKFLTTWCTDGLQLYDTTAPPDVRAQQYSAALAAFPADAFLPFTKSGYNAYLRRYILGADTCVPWPTPRRDVLEPAAASRYPAVPTLVLSGDMDILVPTEYVAEYASRWPQSTYVVFPGAGHGTILSPVDAASGQDGACARRIVSRFLRSHDPGDTRCARVPFPAFATADFPAQVDDATAARLTRRARATTRASEARALRARQAGTVAALTVIDAFKRAAVIGAPLKSRGLRGGRVRVTERSGRLVARLKGARYAGDLAVSGTASWKEGGGQLRAQIQLRGVVDGRLRIRGPLLLSTGDLLTLAGTLGGQHIRLRVPAT